MPSHRRLARLMICLICCSGLAAGEADGPAYLGVTPLPDGFDASGVGVRSVHAGTTAAVLGVRPDDRIVSIDGRAVTTSSDLRSAIANARAGQPIRLVVRRGSDELNLSGSYLGRPSAEAQIEDLKAQNERLAELTAEINRRREAAAAAGPKPVDPATTTADSAATEPVVAPPADDGDLLTAMMQLNRTLEALPERLEAAAKEFKTVYPDGEFSIKIEITIRSSRSPATPADELSDPVAPEPAPVPEATPEP